MLLSQQAMRATTQQPPRPHTFFCTMRVAHRCFVAAAVTTAADTIGRAPMSTSSSCSPPAAACSPPAAFCHVFDTVQSRHVRNVHKTPRRQFRVDTSVFSYIKSAILGGNEALLLHGTLFWPQHRRRRDLSTSGCDADSRGTSTCRCIASVYPCRLPTPSTQHPTPTPPPCIAHVFVTSLHCVSCRPVHSLRLHTLMAL